MLHIILLILKIIGITALVMIGLLLALILLVLFVPIRYRVRGSYREKPQGMAKITWLLHIVSVTASYEEDFVLTVRIFGWPVIKPVEKSQEEEKDFVVQAMESTEQDSEKAVRDILSDTRYSGNSAGSEDENQRKNESEKTDGIKKARDAKRTADAGPASRLRAVLSKLKFSFLGICDKLKNTAENITAKKDAVQEWITNEENRKTVRLLLRQAKKLIIHILPRKGKGNVVFGFGDPYTTGQALTYLSVVYPFCHRHLEFQPVFDCGSAVLEAEGNFRGRIRIGTMLAAVARVLLNKNFRIILKRLRR